MGQGPDVSTVMTYNSQRQRNDDNGDNFSLGAVPSQLTLSGILNTARTITVVSFDGSQQGYTWDSIGSRYVRTGDGGAYDITRQADEANRRRWQQDHVRLYGHPPDERDEFRPGRGQCAWRDRHLRL